MDASADSKSKKTVLQYGENLLARGRMLNPANTASNNTELRIEKKVLGVGINVTKPKTKVMMTSTTIYGSH